MHNDHEMLRGQRSQYTSKSVDVYDMETKILNRLKTK